MNSRDSAYPRRTHLAIAGVVVLVVAVASLAIFRKKQVVVARQEAQRVERVERAAEEDAHAERVAQRVRAALDKQVRAEQEQEVAEREVLAQAEKQRLAIEAERDREERRRRVAEQERLAAAREQAREEELKRQAEERRLAAVLQAQRETEEEANRKKEEAEQEKKRADEEKAKAQADPAPAEADVDDTPEVDTESSIDDVSEGRGWRFSGDLRPIIFFEDEHGRDGETTDNTDVGARVRLRAVWAITEGLRVVGRLAGRCSTEDCDPEFVFDSSSNDGLSDGQFTLDELFIHSHRKERFDIALGRLQTRFVLRGGVYAKSLDRNDSNNANVTWTDGIQAVYRGPHGWAPHFVLQRNARDGTGSIRHEPLDFDNSSARNTYFVGVENLRGWGLVTQRAFDVSYLPSSLLKDGVPDGRRRDYWGLVGRLAMRWPQRVEGLRLRAGVELGYATETPTAEAVGLAGSEDVDGLAWNVVVSAMDFAPGHSVGLNYARTDPGWLLSPQFQPNEDLIEIRYQWKPTRFPLLEARVRKRADIEQLVGTAQRRSELDVYVRLTWQFTIKDF